MSLRLTREVHKDCRISVEGNNYLVSHHYVGKQVIVRQDPPIVGYVILCGNT